MIRPTRSEMLLTIANVIATRSTCDRLHVGALVAREGRILTTGYNGPPSGMSHCIHFENLDGHPEPSCERAVHAEANAIAFAARYGMATGGAELFITHSPCTTCAKLIINAGIVKVYYGQQFRDLSGLRLLGEAGMDVIRCG